MTAKLWNIFWRSLAVLFFICQDFESNGYMLRNRRDTNVRAVYFTLPSNDRTVLKAGPALFGVDLVGKTPTEAKLAIVEPPKGCQDITNGQNVIGKIALVYRGDCMFIEKARNIQKTGAVASIVIDNNPGITAERISVFIMHHGYETINVTIPMVFLYAVEGDVLLDAYRQQPDLVVGVADVAPTAVTEIESTTMTVSYTEEVTTDEEPTTETDRVVGTRKGTGFTETSTGDGQKSGESAPRSDEKSGSKNGLSSGYIALIAVSVLIIIALTVSAVSCYYFCPSSGTMSWRKLN